MTDKAAKTSIFDSLRLFWRLLARDILDEKKRLMAGFVAALITGIFAVMVPYSIQLIIDNAIPQKNSTLLSYYAFGLLVALILGSFFWYVQVFFIARASEDIFRRFKTRLSDSILRKHLSFFSHYQSSDLLTRMVTDLGLVSEFFYKYLLKSLVELVLVVVFLVYILFLNWQLPLIAV